MNYAERVRADYGVREDTDVDELMRQLRTVLQLGGTSVAEDDLDFYGLVYADLSGYDLELRMGETRASKEEKIAQMLARPPRRG